ncbi:hypothetical protein OJ998_19210 [Solirubrobacter taibaiensis]|nr:hypothetical protein [Solirubrobacter taibaiensis]
MLEVTGPDAAAYLDAHLTVRVEADRHGALLTPKGTLLGLVRIERTAAGFRLYSGQPAVAAALERGRIGWMVELTPFTHEEPALSDLERVEARIPAFGRDIDERTLPHEAGLVGTVVRTDKNVYPGMQTVLRQERSGTVHRVLRRLAFDAPVHAGTEVHDDTGPLGTIGTAAISPTRGPLALALLRRRAEPGARVRAGEVSGIVEP